MTIAVVLSVIGYLGACAAVVWKAASKFGQMDTKLDGVADNVAGIQKSVEKISDKVHDLDKRTAVLEEKAA